MPYGTQLDTGIPDQDQPLRIVLDLRSYVTHSRNAALLFIY